MSLNTNKPRSFNWLVQIWRTDLSCHLQVNGSSEALILVLWGKGKFGTNSLQILMAKILVFSAILLLSFNNCSETLFSVNSKSSPSVAPLVDPTVEDQSAQIIESDRIDGVTCGPESQYPMGREQPVATMRPAMGFAMPGWRFGLWWHISAI